MEEDRWWGDEGEGKRGRGGGSKREMRDSGMGNDRNAVLGAGMSLVDQISTFCVTGTK